MTHRVKRSEVGPQYEGIVTAYVKDLNDYRTHVARIAAKEPDVEAYPEPWAEPRVVAAVKEVKPGRFEADFEVEDDLLSLKKAALVKQLRVEEERLVEAALPPAGKRRLLSMEAEDTRKKDKPSRAEAQALANWDKMMERVKAIRRMAATKEAEIDDLTRETISNYQVRIEP